MIDSVGRMACCFLAGDYTGAAGRTAGSGPVAAGCSGRTDRTDRVAGHIRVAGPVAGPAVGVAESFAAADHIDPNFVGCKVLNRRSLAGYGCHTAVADAAAETAVALEGDIGRWLGRIDWRSKSIHVGQGVGIALVGPLHCSRLR